MLSPSVSGKTLTDSGTESEKQAVDDAETDSGSGTFSRSLGTLSTSGTYSQSDDFTDDTDDSESASGDYGTFRLATSGFTWSAPLADTLSMNKDDKASGTWTASGVAVVLGGITQSASGTYSVDDSSEDDATDDDKDSGSLSSGAVTDGEDGHVDLSTSSVTNYISPLDSTNKWLRGFSETASFTQSLDGSLPSVFTSVSFSSGQADSDNTSEAFSTSLSSASYGGGLGGVSNNDSGTDVDADTDQVSGWTSYGQSGSYTTTNDDGLTTTDQDIDTSQAGGVTTANGGTNNLVSHDVEEATSEDFTYVTVWHNQSASVQASSYSAKNDQTDSGNSGSFASGSYAVTTTSGDDTGSYSSDNGDTRTTSIVAQRIDGEHLASGF